MIYNEILFRSYNETIEEGIMASILNPEQLKNNENFKYKFKVVDEKELARSIVLKYIMTSEFYGVRTFLTLYRKFKREEGESKEMKKIGKTLIKYEKIKVLDENNKKIEEFVLKNIKEIMVFPDYVEIVLKETEKIEWVFNLYSSESIHIYRTLELYIQIEKLTEEINGRLLKKLKQQKDVKK